jgi:hypothetical protein
LDGLYFLQFVREINPGWFVFHLFRPAFGRAATVRGQPRVQRLGTAANKNSTRIYFAALRLTNPCCLIALLGYQVELQTIDGRIAEMRRQLGSLTSVPADGASAPQATSKKRTMSTAARKRIAAAQRKRWRAFRKAQAWRFHLGSDPFQQRISDIAVHQLYFVGMTKGDLDHALKVWGLPTAPATPQSHILALASWSWASSKSMDYDADFRSGASRREHQSLVGGLIWLWQSVDRLTSSIEVIAPA